MRTRRERSRSTGLALSVLLVAALGMTMLAPGVEAHRAATWTVVAKDLDSPHGVAFTSDGTMIVTESGHTGKTKVFDGTAFFGTTAKISSIDVATGASTALVKGLPSLSFIPGGFETFGVGGVSVLGDRILSVTQLNPRFTRQAARTCRSDKCADTMKDIAPTTGLLIDVDPDGGAYTAIAGIGAFNYKWVVANDPSPGNPDFAPGDADPYGLLALPEGTYIADGGSNTLSFVDPDGAASMLAYIPDPPNHKPLFDSVATCVAQAGGAIYVGTLTGYLYKWADDELTQVLKRGDVLRDIVGCTSDAAGNLYVVNMAEDFNHFDPTPNSGSVVKIAPDLTTSYVIAPDEGLNYPNGIAFGPDGKLYLTINSICPADVSGVAAPGWPPKDYCPTGGQVVRLDV